MVKRSGMTHEDHVELSKVLANVIPAIQTAMHITGNKLGVSTKSYKALCVALAKYDAARSALDDEYHRVTTNEQFALKGHVYYGGRGETNKTSHTSGEQL
jgi:hypothetical protein